MLGALFERRLARLRLLRRRPKRSRRLHGAFILRTRLGVRGWRRRRKAGRERGGGKEPNETNHNHFLSLDAVSWI